MVFWQIRIKRVVVVIQIVQIQEVRDLDLLVRTHDLTLDRYGFFCARIDNLPLKISYLTSHRSKVGFRYVIKELVKVGPLVRRVEI